MQILAFPWLAGSPWYFSSYSRTSHLGICDRFFLVGWMCFQHMLASLFVYLRTLKEGAFLRLDNCSSMTVPFRHCINFFSLAYLLGVCGCRSACYAPGSWQCELCDVGAACGTQFFAVGRQRIDSQHWRFVQWQYTDVWNVTLELRSRVDISTSGQHIWMSHWQTCTICIMSPLSMVTVLHGPWSVWTIVWKTWKVWSC